MVRKDGATQVFDARVGACQRSARSETTPWRPFRIVAACLGSARSLNLNASKAKTDMHVVKSEEWSGDEWARLNFADYQGPNKAFVDSHQNHCLELTSHNRETRLITSICFTHGFIGRIITDKIATIIDPRSGYRRSTTTCSRLQFGVNQYVVYHFLDGPRLDLVVGYMYGFPVCLVYQDVRTVLQVGSAYICGEFDFVEVARASLQLSPSSVGFLREKPVVWDTADIENLGHSYWQNMTGLDFFQKSGLLSKIDGVTPQKNDFFGLSRYGEKTAKFKNFKGKDALFFRYNDYFIRKTVRETTLRLVPDQLWRKQQSASRIPTVLFQIRSGPRRWVDQVEGISSIIAEITKSRPDIVFLIDGRTRYVGDTSKSNSGSGSEREIFKQIAARIPIHVRLESTIDWEMPEKIARFAQLRAFCGPIGSGFVVLHWVLNRRGVVYGPPGMYGWTKDHGDHANEGLRPLYWYPPDRVEVVDGNDAASSVINVDWRLILEALMTEITHSETELRQFVGAR